MSRGTTCIFFSVIAITAVPVSARAATLKAVQSGTTSSAGNGTVTVTITSVDTTKSFLIFQTRHDNNRPVGSTLRGRIASATTLEFIRASDESSTMYIQWYVVEFSSGVKVQRGEVTETASTINIPITAVASLSQSFVTWSKSAIAGDAYWGGDDSVLMELTTTSNLQLRMTYESSPHVISWQVIEFTNSADINVQKGVTSLTGTTTSVDVTLPTAVDLTKAFVLIGYKTTSSSEALIAQRIARARLINATTVRIDRGTASSGETMAEIAWQVVELRDGAKVQSGNVNFTSGTSTQAIGITTVDLTRAIAFASGQPACGQGMGKTSYEGDDIIGVASATFGLAATSLTARRSNTASSADLGWFVVEFADPCAAPASPTINVLFVVPNASSLTASDAAKRCAMHTWNFGVTLISETATTSQFNTALAAAKVVYISSSVSNTGVSAKLVNQNIGVVYETPAFDDDFKLADADGGTASGTAINIISTCHYITSPFATGSRTITTSSQLFSTTSTTLADDAVTLSRRSSGTTPTMVVEERRNKLYDSSRAAGRRVHLPWGGSAFDFTVLNTDGQLIMRRAIEWGAEIDGTMGIWRFDETSGTIAYDSSNNSRNATLTSMDPPTDWVKGRVDNALDFDGIDDRAVVAGTFDPPGTGTVAFFMQVPGPPARHGRILGVAGNWEVRHVQLGNPDGVAYGIVFDLGDPAASANTDFATTTPLATPGQWYHVAAVFNQTASTYAIYLDGVLHKSGTKTLVLESSGTLTIGTRTGTTDYFVGKLDDLRIYNRELCATEIAMLARARTTVQVTRWAELINKG